MSSAEELLSDDQSHYEVSLTAGQAFLAFVLLLLSLAASFAFGLMIGRQGEDRLSARKDQPMVNETAVAPATRNDRVVELGSDSDEFQPAVEEPAPKPKAQRAVPVPKITEESMPAAAAVTPVVERPTPTAARVPHQAQLFSSSDQKAAENMAAKLIDGGFSSAYVERGTSPKGPVFRVRVRFASEAEARAAEPKLRTFSKDVWITKL